MFVIVGLGNPEKKYENTRHNVGFMAIDALAEKYGISLSEKKHKSRSERLCSKITILCLQENWMGKNLRYSVILSRMQ